VEEIGEKRTVGERKIGKIRGRDTDIIYHVGRSNRKRRRSPGWHVGWEGRMNYRRIS